MLEGRLLTSFIMVGIFALMVGLSFTYEADTRMLPLVIGIPGLIFTLIQATRELRVKKPAPVVTPVEHRREGIMFLWFAIFVGGLILFGFPYAGPVLVAAFLLFVGREKWYVALAAALLAWGILYGVFEEFLGLPLFEGLVIQWFFA